MTTVGERPGRRSRAATQAQAEKLAARRGPRSSALFQNPELADVAATYRLARRCIVDAGLHRNFPSSAERK